MTWNKFLQLIKLVNSFQQKNGQRRIKVNVVTKEPVLLARMAGKTVVCSIVLDDQQLHASPDESKMDIDAVSITGTDDDAVIVDSLVY